MTEPISTATLIRLGLLGARAAGFDFGSVFSKIFGDGGGHGVNVPGLSLPGNLAGTGILASPISAKSFRRFGPQIVGQSKSIERAFSSINRELVAMGFGNEPVFEQADAIRRAMSAASSPGNAQQRNQAAVNALSGFALALEQIKSSRSSFLASNPDIQAIREEFGNQAEFKGKQASFIDNSFFAAFKTSIPENQIGNFKSLFTFPPSQAQLAGERKLKSPVDTDRLSQLARLAKSFIPKPSAARFRGAEFVPSGRGTFAEQAKEQDLIIPPGFISKQPTTLERAIDPNILNGVV